MNRLMRLVGISRPNLLKLTSMCYCDNKCSKDQQPNPEDDYVEYTDQLKVDQVGLQYSYLDAPIPLKRGIRGVFEPEELVTFLRHQNARDIFCTAIAPEMCYADYMVITTCNSKRHIISVAESVRKMYKMKKSERDPFIIIEGVDNNSHDWLAIDMGNIVLHLFMANTRKYYDLETLWSVGAEFDSKFIEMKEHFINAGQSEPIEIQSSETNNLDEVVKNIDWSSVANELQLNEERQQKELKEYEDIIQIRKKELQRLKDDKPYL